VFLLHFIFERKKLTFKDFGWDSSIVSTTLVCNLMFGKIAAPCRKLLGEYLKTTRFNKSELKQLYKQFSGTQSEKSESFVFRKLWGVF